MAKFPLDWHRTNVRNRKHYLQRERERLTQLQAAVDRVERELLIYEEQIARAEERGLSEFDAERFNVPKGGKQ